MSVEWAWLLCLALPTIEIITKKGWGHQAVCNPKQTVLVPTLYVQSSYYLIQIISIQYSDGVW